MKFGDFPIDTCLGGTLAHTTQVNGRTLKKGHCLDAGDIADLKAIGVTSLTIAKLNPDDIHENEAATRVATVLADVSVEVGPAFTGRVNLYARDNGLCVLDEASIIFANQCDEAVTVATLAPFSRVQKGQMIATIKIIPFAAPLAAITELEETLSSLLAIIKVVPFEAKRVALISTVLPGTRQQIIAKGRDVVARRISALGGELKYDQACGHTVEAVMRQLDHAIREKAELILIVGASAIVDRRDVIPLAIETAGGHISHFGMPVDPGNLLLLGRIEETSVIGLPGCVRSPKLNGADWVIERCFANIPIRSEDITAMGIGGLLKEIPTRPQPRDVHAMRIAEPRNMGVVVLAAGQSRRMGPENKLLLPFKGKSMIEHVVSAALDANIGPVVVVTGHEADQIKERLKQHDVVFRHNHRYADGLSTSIRTGISEMSHHSVAGTFICLGDMPHITAKLLKKIAHEFDSIERPICVPTTRGKMGNPVLWSSSLFPNLSAIEGDSGAKSLIGQLTENVHEVAVEDDAIFIDHDTPESLESGN